MTISLRSRKSILFTFVAAVALTCSITAPASAAESLTKDKIQVSRFSYKARQGQDGYCDRGYQRGFPWVCTVDGGDPRPLSITTPGRPDRFFVQGTGRWVTISASQWYQGQFPYCLPDWYRFGTAYHEDLWAGVNHYYCGFFQ